MTALATALLCNETFSARANLRCISNSRACTSPVCPHAGHRLDFRERPVSAKAVTQGWSLDLLGVNGCSARNSGYLTKNLRGPLRAQSRRFSSQGGTSAPPEEEYHGIASEDLIWP